MSLKEESPPPARSEMDVLGRILAVIGLAAHGVVGLIFFAAAGLVAPLYGIIILAIGWSLLLLQAIRWWSSRPRLVILIPIVTFAYWFVVVSFGSRFLGWTA